MIISGVLSLQDSDSGELLSKSTNRIVQSGRTSFLGLMGNISNADRTGMTHIAIGTGSPVTVTDSDINLTDEYHRNSITSITLPDLNTLNVVSLFNKDDCRTVITEAGIFGGSGASSDADSGTMFSHVALIPPVDNSSSNNRNLTASWEIHLNYSE